MNQRKEGRKEGRKSGEEELKEGRVEKKEEKGRRGAKGLRDACDSSHSCIPVSFHNA